MKLLPPEVSTWAADHDAVLLGVAIVAGLFFAGVSIAMAIALVTGARRSHPKAPPSARTRRWLEASWIAVPTLVGLCLFVWGAERYLALGRPPDDALQIMVLGKRWMWRFHHPDGRAEIDVLRVPAGRPVRLVMTSDDVIHSLYVPALRLKQDALPGRYTDLWFEATTPGRYLLLCAEYCGTAHSKMGRSLVVMPPQDYARWARDGAGETPVERGAALYARFGCGSCHDPGAAVAAPALDGIWHMPRRFADGSAGRVDEGYLRRALLRPAAQVVAGYSPLMPSYQGRLDEEDIMALVAWIRAGGGHE